MRQRRAAVVGWGTLLLLAAPPALAELETSDGGTQGIAEGSGEGTADGGADGGASDGGASPTVDAGPPPAARASALPDGAVRKPEAVPATEPPSAALAPTRFETVVIARPMAADLPRADGTAAASVVRPEESPRAFDDLGSLVAETPGVNVVRTGSIGAASTITLRGSNPEQVRIYIDGVPVNVAAGGGVDISTLPIGDVERIEVYRGSSPLAFGPSAMGGIISITTRTPGTLRAGARGGVGSLGTAFGDASGGGRVGPLRLYAGLHGFSTRGDFPYRNDNATAVNPNDDIWGPRENNDLRQVDGVVRAALSLPGRRSLSLGGLGFAREQGLPGRGGIPSMFARFATARGLGYLRYESRDDLGPGGLLSAELFGSLQRDRLDDVRDESGQGGLLRNTTRTGGVNVYLGRPFADWVRGAIVLQGHHETWWPVNHAAAIPIGVPARRLSGVAGTEVVLRVRPLDLDLVPSVRFELVDDVVSARDAAGVPVPAGPSIVRRLPVLRLGLVRPLGRWAALRANVGRYARAPSFVELYGNGTARILGNAALTEERGTNGDLGLWIDRPGERFTIASRTIAFAARVDDLIQWQRASWGQARADNIGQAQIEGLEQDLRIGLGRWVRLVGQVTLLRTRDRSENLATYGKPLPLQPRHRSYLRPEIVRVPLPAGLELGAYADAELRGQMYGDPANLVARGTRLLLGCGLSLAAPSRGLRLTASAANLTGTRREDLDDLSLPGRMVYLSLAYVPTDPADGPPTTGFNPRYGQ